MIKAYHFAIHELVPPKTYTRYGEKCWWFIDPNLIALIDAMRDEFGSATINNYFWGGIRDQSGLRTEGQKHFKPHSQHTHGRAADILFKEFSADDVRKAMCEDPDKWLAIAPSITLEEGVSWVHVDVRNGDHAIRTFKP